MCLERIFFHHHWGKDFIGGLKIILSWWDLSMMPSPLCVSISRWSPYRASPIVPKSKSSDESVLQQFSDAHTTSLPYLETDARRRLGNYAGKLDFNCHGFSTSTWDLLNDSFCTMCHTFNHKIVRPAPPPVPPHRMVCKENIRTVQSLLPGKEVRRNYDTSVFPRRAPYCMLASHFQSLQLSTEHTLACHRSRRQAESHRQRLKMFER